MVSTKAITSSLNETSTVVVDGLGRISQTQLNSDAPSVTYTQTIYDSLGRKSVVYNPTRCSPPTTNCGETTWGYTTYSYDPLNRITSVVRQDGSTASTNYSAFPCTTVTDEAGKSRKSCVDGLGRTTSVWEDPAGLNYETDYQYDVLGNLLKVIQKGGTTDSGNWRTRIFQYDSVSRLTSASNPEFGTTTYTYDADGNVITRTAPSPNQAQGGTATVVTGYTYDKLNRLTGKSYNDSYGPNPATPTVQFGYDGVALSGCSTAPPMDTDSKPLGRRTSMCDGTGAASWTHDAMGRTLQERRTIGTAKGEYDTDKYNLDGSLASMTALGYSVAYTYNGAGYPITAKNSSDPFNYVTSANYAPTGGLTGASMGAAPITVSDTYNNRFQPSILSASTNAATILSLSYDFHASSKADNGNVFQIVNNRDGTRTENFTYNSLKEIQAAYTTSTNWGENYTIDSWGNLTNISRYAGKNNSENLSCAPANVGNQLNTCYSYDSAGNTIKNGTATYTYDAENRLISAGGMSYLYDGDGKRVEKCTAGSTPGTCSATPTGTIYWSGWGSDPLVETDLAGNVQETYVFFNGQRIARRDGSNGAVHFYFSDHLGTHSLITDANGTMPPQVESDYYPYGREIPVSGSDSNHYKFTGKERDNESGLDDFGARYYASSLGRFMKPDPNQTSGFEHMRDPQSWNGYSIARNNPLVS